MIISNGPEITIRYNDLRVSPISKCPVEEISGIIPEFQIAMVTRRFPVPKDLTLMWGPLGRFHVRIVIRLEPSRVVKENSIEIFYWDTARTVPITPDLTLPDWTSVIWKPSGSRFEKAFLN